MYVEYARTEGDDVEEERYQRWLARVNRHLVLMSGKHWDEVENFDFREQFDNDVAPKETAARALDSEGFF